jgi:YidC/Oxa1 family membrane protein insertase
MLVQMPIMILLYTMVRYYQVQFSNGEFLWIGSSLAHKYPLIVAANLALPDKLMLVIYTISMFISQKLTVVDPAQAEQQKMMTYFMPIMFAVMFNGFPSAFMLYWLLFNIVSTTQQYFMLRPQKPGSNDSSGGNVVVVEAVPETPKSLPTNPGKARRRKKKFDIPQLGITAK